MDATALASLIAGLATLSARVLQMWLRGRTDVRLALVRESGLSRRLGALPAGSRVLERHVGYSEVLIEVGGLTAEQGGSRG